MRDELEVGLRAALGLPGAPGTFALVAPFLHTKIIIIKNYIFNCVAIKTNTVQAGVIIKYLLFMHLFVFF